VQSKPLMNPEPVTVMVLPTYAAVGAMEVAVGSAETVRGVPFTVATSSFSNVSCTEDAPVGVPAPMTTVTVVALTYVHDVAAVPFAGAEPTFAMQSRPLMNPEPVTVIVLLV
jgi:hypothetical protein